MGFSVLMSIYEKEKPEYLKKALDSVMNQSLIPDEIFLIEDGMLPEQLVHVIAEYKKKCDILKTYQFKENVQLGRALAKGVELCKNELIARMDTDDIAVYDRFELQYNFMMEHQNIAVCGGLIEEFNDEGTYNKIKQMPETNDALKKYARYRNPMNHMTVMFRKSAVLAAGNYTHFPLLEDYRLWNNMLVMGNEFYNFPRVLVLMRNNNVVYKRRGGKKYFEQYRKLRLEQREQGLLTSGKYIIALILTAIMTLQPEKFRKIMYRKMLRK